MCDRTFDDHRSWADHSISEDHLERLGSLGFGVQAQSFAGCCGNPDEIPTRLPRPLYDEQSAGTLQRRRLRLAFSRSIVSRAAIASQTAARELVLVDALSLETFEPFPRWSPIPGPVPAGFTLSEPRDKEGRAASPTPSEPRRAASPTPSERSTRARSGARRRSGPPVSELGSIQESGVVSEGSGNEGDDDESEEHDDGGEEQDEEATTGAASTPPAITGVAS